VGEKMCAERAVKKTRKSGAWR